MLFLLSQDMTVCKFFAHLLFLQATNGQKDTCFTWKQRKRWTSWPFFATFLSDNCFFVHVLFVTVWGRCAENLIAFSWNLSWVLIPMNLLNLEMSKHQSNWMLLFFCCFFHLPLVYNQCFYLCDFMCRPRRPRPPPPGSYRDPYDDDPYFRDPYADPYYRTRYLPPPPPGYARYDPYYDPYDRRPLPLPSRDPYLRDRLADAYARPHADYYGRRSPPLSAPSASARWVIAISEWPFSFPANSVLFSSHAKFGPAESECESLLHSVCNLLCV